MKKRKFLGMLSILLNIVIIYFWFQSIFSGIFRIFLPKSWAGTVMKIIFNKPDRTF